MNRFPPSSPQGGGRVALLVFLVAGCAAPPRFDPGALAPLLERGRAAETRGDGDEAGRIYERAVREFPDHSGGWALLGEQRRFWAHDLDAARQAFDKALEAPHKDPDSIAFALRGLGEISRAKNRIEGAFEYFEASLKAKPTVEAHRSLSALYATERRDFDKAAHHAKEALDLSPEDPIALLQYAVQMARFKKVEPAEEAFWKAIGIAGCDERGRSEGHVHCCVLYNGACYQAVRGNKAEALSMLKEFFMTPNHRHITKEEILRDPDFESLSKDPDFKALLDYRLPEE